MSGTVHFYRALRRAFMIALLFVPSLYAQEAQDLVLMNEDEASPEKTAQEQPVLTSKKIRSIHYQGNILVSESTLKAKNPYQEGSLFRSKKSRDLIQAYLDMGYFSGITIQAQEVNDQEIDLYITLTEDTPVNSFTFKGNNHLKDTEIEPVTKHTSFKTINDEKLAVVAEQIKNLYQTKGYHHSSVTFDKEVLPDASVAVHVIIDEGPLSRVKRVCFTGNTTIPTKRLRAMTFTKEDWVLGFMDRAGTYHPDALMMDKYVLENFYQSNGFLTARIKNIDIHEDEKTKDVSVTFDIEEGDLYTVSSVSVEGNDIMSEAEMLPFIPITPGELYSKERIRMALQALRLLWGNKGYVFAETNPSLLPDRETKTVALSFVTEPGLPVNVNRIAVVGNTKTRDYVVRRHIDFDEGELLTSAKMDAVQQRIERLGYFDQRQGINWKISRVNEKEADLNLIVKEGKTGNFSAQLGFGGTDPGQLNSGPADSPSLGLRISGSVSDINLFGRGIQYNLGGSYSSGDYSVNASLYNPWLFNRPIGGGLNIYHRKTRYDDLKNVANAPEERTVGGGASINFMSSTLGYTNFVFSGGFDNITNNRVTPRPTLGLGKAFEDELQAIFSRRFESGELAWFNSVIEQDRRNHPLQPSRGYHWTLMSRFGMSPRNQGMDAQSLANFGFYKFEADFRWYTPLINEYDLIFHFHAHFGAIAQFNNRTIPYRELFHIGGPATVRGYTFGQIGPSILGDSLGATKAFFVNIELLFPIRPDNSIRGVIFYDGGAGWDTPFANQINASASEFRNNSFNYRHAIGFGVRLTSPTPMRVDWGFKLDHRKRLGEAISEIHFNMSHDF